MQLSSRRLAAVFFAALSVACSSPARAFLINLTPPAEVVEFRNLYLNHYFLTANRAEMAGIDAGLAGPGWYRTGYGFRAYASKTGDCQVGCEAVSRFYGTPGLGPNSHFYTAEAAEAQGLTDLPCR